MYDRNTGLPLFTTDGLAHYQTVLLTHFGYGQRPPSQPAGGSTPKLRWWPLPGLVYAQIIKHLRHGCLVRVKQRLIFGRPKQSRAILDRLGWKVNTAFVEGNYRDKWYA